MFCSRRLYSIARIGWSDPVSNAPIRIQVLGPDSILSQRMEKLGGLCWLDQVLRMVSTRLPNHALFSVPPTEWKKLGRGQKMTWQRGIRKFTENLAKISAASSWLMSEESANRLAVNTKDVVVNFRRIRMVI